MDTSTWEKDWPHSAISGLLKSDPCFVNQGTILDNNRANHANSLGEDSTTLIHGSRNANVASTNLTKSRTKLSCRSVHAIGMLPPMHTPRVHKWTLPWLVCVCNSHIQVQSCCQKQSAAQLTFCDFKHKPVSLQGVRLITIHKIAPLPLHLRCCTSGGAVGCRVIMLRRAFLPCAMTAMLKSHWVLLTRVCATAAFLTIAPNCTMTMMMAGQWGISFGPLKQKNTAKAVQFHLRKSHPHLDILMTNSTQS